MLSICDTRASTVDMLCLEGGKDAAKRSLYVTGGTTTSRA